MGDPVDPLFCDRDVFADFFTRYYTDWEPENVVVAEAEGNIVGYLTACLRYRLYPWVQMMLVAAGIAPKVVLRLGAGRYDRRSIRFLVWFLLKSFAETPRRPAAAAHFHINLLPAWREGKASRKLIFSFLDSLPRLGIKRVYGQIQTYAHRRPPKVFQRYGFELFDRRRITKFDRFKKEPVYVSTFWKQFKM